MRRPGLLVAGTTCLLLASMSAATVIEDEPRIVDPPAGSGAFGVEIAPDGDGVLATWIEPAGDGAAIQVARFGPARVDGEEDDPSEGWTTPRVVTSRNDLFANWADRPAVRRLADGSLLSHDLRKIAAGTYAYGVRLQRSTDDGASWTDLGWLHDDARAVEHGFASIVATPRGAVGVWLDGRNLPEQTTGHADHEHHATGASMILRTAEFDPTSLETARPPMSTGLDARVCECCDTDLAWTTNGPVVVYRDRGPNEERDISIVRLIDGDWTIPTPVHRDGWRIEACPVNGPAIAASGRRVVVAWYTAATGDPEEPAPPRVLVAMSTDAGITFSEPAVVSESTVGRVDVILLPDGAAIVSWVDLLESSTGPLGDLGIGAARDLDGERGSLACRRLRTDGTLGPVTRLATMHLGRRAGFPRIALLPLDEQSGLGPRLFAIWRDEDADRLRAVTLSPP